VHRRKRAAEQERGEASGAKLVFGRAAVRAIHNNRQTGARYGHTLIEVTLSTPVRRKVKDWREGLAMSWKRVRWWPSIDTMMIIVSLAVIGVGIWIMY
jgi:hypothetical protein